MDLQALYTHRFSRVSQANREKVWTEISRYVGRVADSPRKILDPACGRGEFINTVSADEKWAMDLGHDGSSLESNVRFIRGSFLDEHTEIPRNHFDLVFLSNILEHMPNPEAVNTFVRRARDLLAPGGRVVILGPNFRYCMKSYFDFADHVVPLTHISIVEHLVTAGFEPSRVIPRFIPYSFTSRLPANGLFTRLYLAFPLAWRILGKQFLVVGSKPTN